MAGNSFYDQYKHPLWQKKRLEALEAAGFACQRCCDEESTLHVHHKLYVKGRKIWEYTNTELEVLCDLCHSVAHEEKEMLQMMLAMLPSDAIGEVIGLIAGYCHKTDGPAGCDMAGPISYVGHNRGVYAGMISGVFACRNTKQTLREFCELVETSHATGKKLQFSLIDRES